MVSRRHINPVYAFIWKIGQSPLAVLEFAQYALLGWVLLQTLAGFGGFLPFGEPMVGVSRSLLALTVLHALVLALRQERPGIDWELLLPLPLLAYVWLHYRFLSAAPWETGPVLAMLVQAYALYFVAFNMVDGLRAAKWLVATVQVVVWLALLAAILQYYMFADWMPVEGRLRNPAYAAGAAGFLQDPQNLGGLLLAVFPLGVLLVAKHLGRGPVWILQGFLAITVVTGFLLCSNLFGLAILALLILLLPLFITDYTRSRMRIWKYTLLAAPVVLFLMWFGTGAMRDRLAVYLAAGGDPVAEASRAVAIAQFLAAPLAGHGPGAFAMLWDAFAPGPQGGASLYPFSLYAGLLAETGVAGLLLVAAPLGLLLWVSFRVWLRAPFLRLSPEDVERLNRLPAGHRRRRRTEREKGRLSTQKTYLGGLLLGILGLLLYAAFDYAYALPVTVFILACLLAALAAFARSFERRPERGRRWIGAAVLPFALAVWAAAFGMPRYYASHLVYTGSERLVSLLEDPDRIFNDPGSLSYVENAFTLAAGLVPAHADALIAQGTARLGMIHANLKGSREIAQEAYPLFARALEIAPQSWRANYEMARIQSMLEADAATVDALLERALELAPHRAEPAGFLGSLLLNRDPGSARGRELLERSLSLNPDYRPALAVRQQLLARLPSDAGNARGRSGSGIVTEAILAEQFWPVVRQAQRVLGAGLPEVDELYPAAAEPES